MTITRRFQLAAVACAAAAFVSLLAPTAALAQQASSSTSTDGSRWWAGIGGGYLAGRADCSNCETEPPYDDGFGFIAQGGIRVNQRLLAGAEVFSSTRSMPSGDFRETHVLAIVQFRPFERAGFFLKGGYGMALAKGSFPVDGGESTMRTWGMGVMYGAGWMFRRDRRIAIAPVAATYITTIGDIQVPQGTASNVVVNGWFAGATVMFR